MSHPVTLTVEQLIEHLRYIPSDDARDVKVKNLVERDLIHGSYDLVLECLGTEEKGGLVVNPLVMKWTMLLLSTNDNIRKFMDRLFDKLYPERGDNMDKMKREAAAYTLVYLFTADPVPDSVRSKWFVAFVDGNEMALSAKRSVGDAAVYSDNLYSFCDLAFVALKFQLHVVGKLLPFNMDHFIKDVADSSITGAVTLAAVWDKWSLVTSLLQNYWPNSETASEEMSENQPETVDESRAESAPKERHENVAKNRPEMRQNRCETAAESRSENASERILENRTDNGPEPSTSEMGPDINPFSPRVHSTQLHGVHSGAKSVKKLENACENVPDNKSESTSGNRSENVSETAPENMTANASNNMPENVRHLPENGTSENVSENDTPVCEHDNMNILFRHGMDTGYSIVKKALRDGAFTAVAMIIQTCARHYANLYSCKCTRKNTPTVTLLEDIRYALTVNPITVSGDRRALSHIVLQVCRDNGLYGAAAILAVWIETLPVSRRAHGHTAWRHHLSWSVDVKRMAIAEYRNSENIAYLIHQLHPRWKNHCWLLLELLTFQPDSPWRQAVVRRILLEALPLCNFHTGPYFVVKHLMTLCADRKTQNKIVFRTVRCGLYYLFCRFLNFNQLDLGPGAVPVLTAAVSFYSDAVVKGMPSVPSRVLIIRKCIEIGLSTQPSQIRTFLRPDKKRSSTPFKSAVKMEHLPLVKLLYFTGATTNAEVYTLREKRALRRMELTQQTPEQHALWDFLNSKASNVRSLQNLCCLAASRWLGCRADRKDLAFAICDHLHLPPKIVPMVLFYDVLFDLLPVPKDSVDLVEFPLTEFGTFSCMAQDGWW